VRSRQQYDGNEQLHQTGLEFPIPFAGNRSVCDTLHASREKSAFGVAGVSVGWPSDDPFQLAAKHRNQLKATSV
jgi:hypothetical protein